MLFQTLACFSMKSIAVSPRVSYKGTITRPVLKQAHSNIVHSIRLMLKIPILELGCKLSSKSPLATCSIS